MKIIIFILSGIVLISCHSKIDAPDDHIHYLDSIIQVKNLKIQGDSVTIIALKQRRDYLQHAGDSLLQETLTYKSVCLRMLRYIDVAIGNPNNDLQYLKGWANDSFKPYLQKKK